MNFLLAILIATQATDIRFPEREPTPSPETDTVSVIGEVRSDEWYIIESDSELIAITSPAGIASVTADTGPLKIKGKFADSGGRTETRTYSAKHIYTVEAVAQGKCELILIPVGVSAEAELVRQMLSVLGSRPPPGPGPDDDDPPKPPIPADGKRVLILYESAEMSRYPQSQVNQFTSSTLREYLRTHCSPGPVNGTPEFRIWDKDTDLTNAPQVWRDAMALPRGTLPQLIVSNGVEGFSGPLPATEAETLAILRKYLGD